MTPPSSSRRRFLSLAVLGFTAPALLRAAGAAEGDLARELVARADEIRFPRESFQTDITVRNFSDGQPGDQRVYRVLSRGNENTIVLTMEPASERGQALLMRGRDLWIFMPSVSQPVRLSLAQRLTGQVANGDLARANFAGDYNPVLSGTEEIDGQPCHVLELTATERSVTYARVRYWVRQDDARPVKAEFYALSGRLLKTCAYLDFQEMAGRVRPTRLVMTDALKAGESSELTYADMNLRDLPERMFTREYLRRLN
ncbi:outer membrane lipoprotein-sorting protein [Pseudothauera nasutitermitis]|uniref:Outer membrane lipoprotein-sorting protein n=1 Tax=Pseudothauera nasutitermitis TaxID=2565930 RepID=A0A4S4AVR2_9RHOO|nr:outer membrane lipoprotein-sorting protein [Pseudothauera nasutitermitis]THF63670.1 outer membrane lipoprotein-sorting protein [Pseudothauera nasutitermitis]